MVSVARIAVGLVVVLLCAQLGEARNRQRARATFEKARAAHDVLLKTPLDRRELAEYSRVVFLYRRVVDHDPTYGASDDALYFVASLYDEMWSRFAADSYRTRAIHYYDFVAKEYPHTKFRSTALERAAELQRPASAAAEPDGQPPAPAEGAAEPVPDMEAGELATISEIRYWTNQDYTRVVIQLDREISFQKHVLHSPDRIFFDLQSSRLDAGLDRNYEVNDLLIKRIRLAENRPGVVRVVLDFDRINKHSVFALYDPFRIVIDTGGAKRADLPQEPRAADDPVKTAEATINLKEEADNVEPVLSTMPEPNLSGDFSLARTLGLKIGRVVLDPGHGGHDTGTIGPSGLREKDLVLAISLKLKDLLEQRLGTEVILTRSTDRFIPLEERTAIANQKGADLFVSIHANASRDSRVAGVETFFLNFASTAEEREVATRENSTSQKNFRELEDLLRQVAMANHQESRELAHIVQLNLHQEVSTERPRTRNRGVKTAPFIVLIGSNMPSILTEVGFLSNPSEEKFFKTETGQNALAEALYKGIENYFRSLGTLPLYERVAVNQTQ